ncbi:LysE/ArgO family amino acid transporter [Poseidonibacter lekithochrous]|uniref:LysE/ArgO family amino acid transporter n=1 Tax=Poseidonibacter TaxID=2321187 RepID=UPI001C09E256|nr:MULTISPECIES: LysE/ArgO family amino acid transporter [Poseidonibacter]MBU3013439.1 LysE/ArgO family amino acid transporter [Poseidonibacter lekithochrous]MDO6826736.1 LysE/ArgO family amino acid transporter [Poseidonibacter sp. 1_MG-2023]
MVSEILLKGFIVTFSLIVAIGAQNAYILKLGLLKQYVFTSVILCILFDTLLISAGVFGLGFFIQGNQLLINIIAVIGILFLSFYAFMSFKSAFKNESLEIDGKNKTNPLKQVVGMLLVFTFLNPHTYLDTILLIGGIGANIQDDLKIFFLLGAISASTVWFVLLGFGARLLIPLFKKPITWKILDISIGIIMLIIAYSLIDLIVY